MTEIKNSKIQRFFRTQPVLKAYLFGSYSRDDESDNSDFDILVELDVNVDLFQFISIKMQLEKLLNRPVDLVSANGLSPRIKRHIDRDKILIYEK